MNLGCTLKVPIGHTVPGGADIHLGNTCDTYGIFAIPGTKRKICPTFGLLINQMFYAVQMQIVPSPPETGPFLFGITCRSQVESKYAKRILAGIEERRFHSVLSTNIILNDFDMDNFGLLPDFPKKWLE